MFIHIYSGKITIKLSNLSITSIYLYIVTLVCMYVDLRPILLENFKYSSTQ